MTIVRGRGSGGVATAAACARRSAGRDGLRVEQHEAERDRDGGGRHDAAAARKTGCLCTKAQRSRISLRGKLGVSVSAGSSGSPGRAARAAAGAAATVTRSSLATRPPRRRRARRKPIPVRNVATPDIGRPEHRDLADPAVGVEPDAVRARHGAARHPALPEERVRVAALELVHDPELLERLEDAAVGVRNELAALEGRAGDGGVEDDVRAPACRSAR